MAAAEEVEEPAELVTIEREGVVAIVRLNRPRALNALNRDVMQRLAQVVEELEADPATRGVVLTGSGNKAFAAGADIKQMASYGAVDASRMARSGQQVLNAISRSPKVWVAAVNGFALGGGCEVAMACDFILCSDDAVFGQPEVTIGVTPGFAGTQRLARLVGRARAMELVLSGRKVQAEEAVRIGLAVRSMPKTELLAHAVETVKAIAANAPVAVRLSKELIHRGTDTDLDTAQAMEADAFAICFSTKDQKEGMTAFLEKRRPDWKGE